MTRWSLALVMLTAAFVAGCTGSGDGDGLDTQVETNGWVVDVTYPNGTTREYHTTSDPGLADTDGDGLNDFQELQVSADPRKIDTDDDRLLDGPMQCPEAGSDLAQKVLEQNILEHPEEEGCYLGEASWEYRGMTIKTKPHDAHSDDSVNIGDGLVDSREIIGWNVTVSGRTYHVISNPSTPAPDTDSDGLHDGHELALKTDPTKKDTDEDGFNDYVDAAPVGNLVVTVRLDRIEIKEGQELGGGANVRVDVHIGDQQGTMGPRSVPSGTSQPNMQATFDVDDQGEPTEGEPYAAGHWTRNILLSFWHEDSGGESELEVRSGNPSHVLDLSYDAMEDPRTGRTESVTSSGDDAKVWINVTSRVET